MTSHVRVGIARGHVRLWFCTCEGEEKKWCGVHSWWVIDQKIKVEVVRGPCRVLLLRATRCDHVLVTHVYR